MIESKGGQSLSYTVISSDAPLHNGQQSRMSPDQTRWAEDGMTDATTTRIDAEQRTLASGQEQ